MLRILRRATTFLVLAAMASPAFADGQNIDKVNGSITAEAGQRYGSLETVNGSIRLDDRATIDSAETVNGSIRAADNIRARSLSTVNGSIRVGTGAQLDKGIETVNGSIFVDRGGRIGGDVSTVNGAIGLVDTDLAGGIETVSGDITVGVNSHVKGGIHVEKPNRGWMPFHIGRRQPQRIVIGPNAVVEGPMVFEREVKLYVHASARIGRVSGATAVRYSTPTPPQG